MCLFCIKIPLGVHTYKSIVDDIFRDISTKLFAFINPLVRSVNLEAVYMGNPVPDQAGAP